jgi:hypothetical protein
MLTGVCARSRSKRAPAQVEIEALVNAAMAEHLARLGGGPKLPAKSPDEMQTSLNTKETNMATGSKCPKCGHEGESDDFRKSFAKVHQAGAAEELDRQATEYMKAHPELTPQQAFDKVYNAPGNADLRLSERNERLAKMQGAA